MDEFLSIAWPKGTRIKLKPLIRNGVQLGVTAFNGLLHAVIRSA